MSAALEGHGTKAEEIGVFGEADRGDGVRGLSHAPYKSGVIGINDNTTPQAGPGLQGQSAFGPGLIGESARWHGVYGKTDSAIGGAGVMGEGVAAGPGVIGKSKHWHGVYGETAAAGATGAAAVWGENKADGSGVVGHSASGVGVFGKSETGAAGVFAGRLEVHGDVEVTGDIRLLGGDLAELFDSRPATQLAEPGTVMSLDEDGTITPSASAYDKKVIGVIAGAGSHRPGMILDAGCGERALPIAMAGKTYCRADASFAPIEVGDLLTASPTPGHAMKAVDPSRAFGTVIGKAMTAMPEGTGLLSIVVTLQ